MSLLITILSILTSILLIVVVLVQNSKGGGLDSSMVNMNQLGGAAQSTETIEKVTWTLAGTIGGLSLLAAIFLNTSGNVSANINTNIESKGTAPTEVTLPSGPAVQP